MEDQFEIDATRQPIVVLKDGEVFANSRDVAAYFTKRHDHVLDVIDNLLKAGNPENPGLRNLFVEHLASRDGGGRPMRDYDMTRDGFTLIAMGFTGEKALKWKLKYIEAFNAMEEELRRRKSFDATVILNDPAAMRGILLSYTEKVIALEAEKAAMAPKVEALERIAEADGSLCVTDAAKTLQVRPQELFRFLRSHNWIYRRVGADHDCAYQAKLASGLLEHKTSTVTRSDGSEKVTTQVRVTPKGLTRLAQEFPASVRVA